MDFKDLKALMEGYSAVYTDESENISIEEDLSFIDDLSDNELDQIMEEILSEGVELSECVEVFEELISEMNPYAPAGSKEAKAYAKSTTKSKRSAEASERRTARMERIKGAAKRAGEKAKTLGAGAVSAAAGGAAKVGGKLRSAKEKISGLVKRVGSAVKAGASAAKKEFGGQSSREAKARETGREMRRSARKQAAASRAKDTSAFSGASTKSNRPPKVTVGKREKAGGTQPAQATASAPNAERIEKAKAKLKRAASGTKGGVRFVTPSGQAAPTAMKSGSGSPQERGKKAKQFAKKAGLADHYVHLLDAIFEDMMLEGYVNDYDTAYNVVGSLSENDLFDILESYNSYLAEEVETFDLYDVVLEYLIAEGYADTNKAALAIMANMSEEWRDEILEETKRTEYLQKKFNKENQKKSGSAHTYIPGKQNTGQALYKARESERQMRGER
jgi:hypothetical protein